MKKSLSKTIFALATAMLLAGCTTPVSNSSVETSSKAPEASSIIGASSSVGTVESSLPVVSSTSAPSTSTQPSVSSSIPAVSSSVPTVSSSTTSSSSSSAPVVSTFTISIVNSDHLTLRTTDQYGQDKSTFAQGDKVVVKIDGASPTGYAVKKLEYGTKGADSLDHWSYTEIDSVDASGNYYFTMPYVAQGGSICIRVSERNMAVLSGYNLVGSYLGIDISIATSRDFTAFSDGSDLTIESDGTYTYKSNEGLTIETATASQGEGSATFAESYRGFYYSDKLIYGSTYPTSDAAFGSFDYIAVKKENASDADSLYSTKTEVFKIEDKIYIAIMAFKDGAFYAGGFIDKGAKKAYLDVTFEFLNGESVIDAKTLYNVKKGQDILYTISSELEGGAAHRIVPVFPYGVFDAGNNKSLILLGDGKSASYDGVDFNLSLAEDGVTATLTAGLRSVVGTIDTDKMTFTVISDEEAAASETPKYAGGIYTGRFSNNDDETMYWKLTFAEDGKTVTSCCGYTDSFGYAPWLAKTSGEVAYDQGAGTVSFNLQNFNDSIVEMQFAYDYFGDSLTCNTNYNSYFLTKNAVLRKK